ncbi:MAG: hypothetical protein LBC53_07630 [Spirochaetaceae bacterium]|nr:hypothetical protein [Spirochaetaceae bacterium]
MRFQAEVVRKLKFPNNSIIERQTAAPEVLARLKAGLEKLLKDVGENRESLEAVLRAGRKGMRRGIQAELRDAAARDYGCYALCLAAWAEKDAGRALSDVEVLEALKRAREKGFIGADCYVMNPAGVYNIVYGGDRYGCAVKVYSLREAQAAGNSYIICNKKPMYAYFTAVLDGESFAPLPPGRPGAAGYKPESYRVLKR